MKKKCKIIIFCIFLFILFNCLTIKSEMIILDTTQTYLEKKANFTDVFNYKRIDSMELKFADYIRATISGE